MNTGAVAVAVAWMLLALPNAVLVLSRPAGAALQVGDRAAEPQPGQDEQPPLGPTTYQGNA